MTESASPDVLQMVGAVLNGRWKLTRVLGEGGMGAVFAATSTETQQVAAIKVLHREFVGEPTVTGRFFAEAEAIARMDHPGIVRILEGKVAEDGSPYLVMELLEGRPLSSWLEPREPLSPPHVAAVGKATLEAIGYAHQLGIVHRDIKPENVFVLSTPGRSPVKIVDFGIAKVMDAAGGMGSKTRTGMFLGTPGYMSPEQIANARNVDPRSDLFSIGILLFEMLAGTDPFPTENPMEKIQLVIGTDAPPPSAFVPQLTAFDPFFRRALARRPEDRFGSAAEMAAGLADAVALHASGGAAPAPMRRGSRPELTTQMSQMRPSDAPPAKASMHPDQIQVAPAPPIAPESLKSKTSLWPFITAVVGLLCLGAGIAIGWFLHE
jgi:eukaryotic-like serine/threonine-protein kinase